MIILPTRRSRQYTAFFNTLSNTDVQYILAKNSILHLDASNKTNFVYNTDPTIKTWTDISAKNITHATQSTGSQQPKRVDSVKNGLSIARFTYANNQWLTTSLDLTLTTNPNVTGFAVWKNNVASTTLSKFIGSDGGFGRVIGFDNRASTYNLCYFNGSGVAGIAKPAEVAANSWNLLSWKWNASNSSFSAWLNKVQKVAEVANNSTANGQSTTAIGRAATGGTEYWDGDIAEIILINRILSDTERQAIENMLSTKWGL